MFPLHGRQTAEGLVVYQRLQRAAGEQPEERLQKKFLF